MWRPLRLTALLSGVASALSVTLHRNGALHHSSEADAEFSDAWVLVNAASQQLENLASNTTNTSKANHTLPPAAAALHNSQNRTAVLKRQRDALQDLLGHLKTNIAKFNKAESTGKDQAEKMIRRVQERLEKDRERLNSTNLSAFDHEMLTNRTRMEENELKYWSRGREIQHGMFHSNLKMTHGLMSRVRTVIDAYKDVLEKGRINPKLAQDMKSLAAALPKVLIEVQQETDRQSHELSEHMQLDQ